MQRLLNRHQIILTAGRFLEITCPRVGNRLLSHSCPFPRQFAPNLNFRIHHYHSFGLHLITVDFPQLLTLRQVLIIYLINLHSRRPEQAPPCRCLLALTLHHHYHFRLQCQPNLQFAYHMDYPVPLYCHDMYLHRRNLLNQFMQAWYYLRILKNHITFISSPKLLDSSQCHQYCHFLCLFNRCFFSHAL